MILKFERTSRIYDNSIESLNDKKINAVKVETKNEVKFIFKTKYNI